MSMQNDRKKVSVLEEYATRHSPVGQGLLGAHEAGSESF
jgi:hypothetical protein